MKAGYRTTEWWGTVALAAGGLATALGAGTAVSDEVKMVVAAAGGLAVSVYTVIRGVVKAKAGTSAPASSGSQVVGGP